jgi:hypothetical protein
MKLRGLNTILLCLVISLVSLVQADVSIAQMVPQPPFLAPYTPGMTSGLFYFNAGVKYRNIQTVRFEIVPHTVSQIQSLGTVPWGPEQEGTVFYPLTPNTADPDPEISGIWPYDDGTIDSRASTVVGAISPIAFSTTGGNLVLGYRTSPQNNVGSFTVSSPATQTDNAGGTYQDTTSITYSKRLDDTNAYETASRIFVASMGYREGS